MLIRFQYPISFSICTNISFVQFISKPILFSVYVSCNCQIDLTFNTLKLVSAIFCQIVIFHQMIALQKDIQIFVFLSSPLFSPVSHCCSGWSMKNLKVYDIINCLSKNLITFCLIFWERNKVWHWSFVHW